MHIILKVSCNALLIEVRAHLIVFKAFLLGDLSTFVPVSVFVSVPVSASASASTCVCARVCACAHSPVCAIVCVQYGRARRDGGFPVVFAHGNLNSKAFSPSWAQSEADADKVHIYVLPFYHIPRNEHMDVYMYKLDYEHTCVFVCVCVSVCVSNVHKNTRIYIHTYACMHIHTYKNI